MSNSLKKGILIAIVCISLIVSAGAGYLYQASILKPIFETLEQENTQRLETIRRLNASLQYTTVMNTFQNSTISSLETENIAYEEQLNNVSQQLLSLLQELNETKHDLNFYKTISKRFYETNPIRIGLTSATDADEKYIRDIAEKAEIDIHRYAAERDIPYRFDFVIGNNFGSVEMAISNTINYDALGINLIVGHGWDSQCSATLNYANTNDIILLSPSSSSVQLAKKDDNLFRLSVNETQQLDANIECMKSMSIKYVIVFSINSDWGKSMSTGFAKKLSETEIELIKVEYYPDDPNISIYSSLYQLSKTVSNATSTYGKDQVALQIFSNDRISDLLGGTFESILDIIWFGTEDNAYKVFKSPNTKAQRVIILSPVPVSNSPDFTEFKEEIRYNYGFNVSYYGANVYDACWLYALSIMKTGSTNTQDIKEALPAVSREYQGVTGDCSLNACGDRDKVDYNIMGYSYTHNRFVVYGYYNSTQKTIILTREFPHRP